MSFWVFILCFDSDYLKMELCTLTLVKYMGCFLSHPWVAAVGLMNSMVLCAPAVWKHKQFLYEHFIYRCIGRFLPILMHITLKWLSKNILVNYEKLLQIWTEITSPKISNIFPLQVFNWVHHWGFMFLHSVCCDLPFPDVYQPGPETMIFQ